MITPVARLRQVAVAQACRLQQRVEKELVMAPGALYDCARLLREQDVRCVMVITTPGFVRRGTISSFTHDLVSRGITAAVFSEVTPDPNFACVEQAAAFFRSHGCEAMVAIGGGSVMDTAKVAGALVARPKKRVRDIIGLGKVGKPIPYLIAVPTTAGTGSEVTAAAVVTDDERQRKFAISDVALIPDAAVLDANLLVGLPSQLTAYTGMDALTHAVEAYLNRYGSRAAREAAEEAVALVFKHLKASYDDGGNVSHREGMLMASYYAGFAFSNAFVGYVHALAHGIGGRYHVQHGLANAVLLPVVLEEYGKAAEPRLARLAEAAGLGGAGDHEMATRFIASIRELAASIGIPETIQELREQDIAELAKGAEEEGNPTYPVPEIWDRERFSRVLRAVLPPAGEVREGASPAGETDEDASSAETQPSAPQATADPSIPGLGVKGLPSGVAAIKPAGARVAAASALVGAAAAVTALAIRLRKK